MSAFNGLGGKTLENLNSSIANRKPAYLASILVETLKESGWTAWGKGYS